MKVKTADGSVTTDDKWIEFINDVGTYILVSVEYAKTDKFNLRKYEIEIPNTGNIKIKELNILKHET